MLHVALDELTRRRAEHVLARDSGLRHGERRHVLKLIAKPVRASGLIQRRPRPHATRQRLVQQPPVEQDVHGSVRRRDLHPAEDVVPVLPDFLQDGSDVAAPIANDQLARLLGARRLPEEEHDLRPVARRQLDGRLERAAGVKAGADPS